MILDSIDNIVRYKTFNVDLFIGLQYLQKLSPTVDPGEYILSEEVTDYLMGVLDQAVNQGAAFEMLNYAA